VEKRKKEKRRNEKGERGKAEGGVRRSKERDRLTSDV
jgi:hypothetical protein